MSEGAEVLALRKEVLLARSSLLRLKAASELGTLRETLTLPRTAMSVVASPRALSVLFGVLLLMAGRGRIAKLLRIAAGVAAIVKLARAFTAAKPAASEALDPGP